MKKIIIVLGSILMCITLSSCRVTPKSVSDLTLTVKAEYDDQFTQEEKEALIQNTKVCLRTIEKVNYKLITTMEDIEERMTEGVESYVSLEENGYDMLLNMDTYFIIIQPMLYDSVVLTGLDNYYNLEMGEEDLFKWFNEEQDLHKYYGLKESSYKDYQKIEGLSEFTSELKEAFEGFMAP